MNCAALKRLEAIRQRNADKEWVNRDLYRLFYKKELYVPAYEAIRSNPGNRTAETEEHTDDGFTLKMLDNIIEEMKDESFRFQPVNRISVTKRNGKKRPFGIPSFRDKVVQKALVYVLEAIYDSPAGAYFRDCSHGSRPGKNIHTALREYRRKWSGINWIIRGGIRSFFDDADHHILCDILRRRISDERFISLIRKALNAGYWAEETGTQRSVHGMPRGDLLNPILSNIYLSEFDNFVMNICERECKCGAGERPSRDDGRLEKIKARCIGKGLTPENSPERIRQIHNTPAGMANDPKFREVKYIRYADDWIIGVTGPKSLAERIRNECGEFLSENLGLTLNDEKTEVIHAKSEYAEFLGVLLGITDKGEGRYLTKQKGDTADKTKVTGWQPSLKIPSGRLVKKLKNKGYCDGNGYPEANTGWIWRDDADIVQHFSDVNKGLSDYYRFADNFSAMSRIQYILKYSCAKTLAAKHRSSVSKVFRKHGKNLVVTYEVGGKIRKKSFWHNKGYKRKPNAFMTDRKYSKRFMTLTNF
jgi:group II intron reverse transcriptase/maturase